MLDLKNIGFTAVAGGSGDNLATVSSPSPTATSGDLKYYKFTSTGNITVDKEGYLRVLIQAGGGNGNSRYYGAGSGAGGMYYDYVEVSTGTYSMVVGGGGSNSTAFGKTAIAGGRGQSSSTGITAGGCGGGVYFDYSSSPPSQRIALQPTSTDGGFGGDGGTGQWTSSSNRVSGGGGGTDQDGYTNSSSSVGSNGGWGKTDTQLNNILSLTSSGENIGGTRYLGGGGAATGGNHGTAGGDGGRGGGAHAGDSQSNTGFIAAKVNTGGGASGCARYVSANSGASGLIVVVTGEAP